MRLHKIAAIDFLLTVFLVEIFSFLLFKENLRSLYPEYWHGSRISPINSSRYHLSKHPKRGFDIAPNSRRAISNDPPEISPYPVWGNKIGCFDNDAKNNQKYSIYLAGDSVTWGYAPLEKKFGSILEDLLDLNIAACGVTNTGQMHQFDKFKHISSILGYFPNLVIVNYVSNDIDNDFSHPHSTIVDGILINSTRINIANNLPQVSRASDDTLKSSVEKAIASASAKASILPDFRKFSATAILMSRLFSSASTEIRSLDCGKLEVHGVAQCFSDNGAKDYPISSRVAAKNRNAITNWIHHSSVNNYVLIFVDVETQFFWASDKYFIKDAYNRQQFCDFIRKNGAKCFSFVEYLHRIGISDWRTVRWKRDGHLNLEGNKLYADFLREIYYKLNQKLS